MMFSFVNGSKVLPDSAKLLESFIMDFIQKVFTYNTLNFTKFVPSKCLQYDIKCVPQILLSFFITMILEVLYAMSSADCVGHRSH